MLKTPHTGGTDWVFYIAELMGWLNLRADYDEYSDDPRAPWPHSFVVQDMVQAFVTMAMFFPESEIAANVMKLFDHEWEKLRNSAIFDPRERSKTLPDRRSRTSYKFRDPKFWQPWKDLGKTKRYFADVYPMDWSLAVRPIVAKCQFPFCFCYPLQRLYGPQLTNRSISRRNHRPSISAKRPGNRPRRSHSHDRASPSRQTRPLYLLRGPL